MRTLTAVILALLLLVAVPHACSSRVAAQQPGAGTRRPGAGETISLPRDTLFDFLVGEWRVEASPRVSKLAAFVHGVPRFEGHWRGRRTNTGVSDEVRVSDAAGNTRMVLRFERVFDATSRSWSVRETDREGTRSGRLIPIVTQTAITLPAATRVARTRFVERTPTRFRYLREISNDGGSTWEEPVLVITATRHANTALPPR